MQLENPGELGMGAHRGLVEQDVLFGIDAAGDDACGHFARRMAQRRRILPLCDGVQVDHAEYAVVLVLQRDPVTDRAEVVAQRRYA